MMRGLSHQNSPAIARALNCWLVALLIALAGCSWYTDFAIVNLTAQTITIRYWLKADTHYNKRPSVAPFRIARRIRGGPLFNQDIELAGDWAPAPTTFDYSCPCFVTTASPRTAVRIATLRNYSRPTLDDWRDLPIERLDISAGEGTTKLCGPSILLAFEGGSNLQSLLFSATPRQLRLNFCADVA